VRAALDELRADLQQRPFDAPKAARLAALGLGPRQLASLVRTGELLRVAAGVVLLPGADDRAVEVLGTLGPEFTLSAARQALGTTRRVAVPLLELLARTGRTGAPPTAGTGSSAGARLSDGPEARIRAGERADSRGRTCRLAATKVPTCAGERADSPFGAHPARSGASSTPPVAAAARGLYGDA
jgi:hypothetical protein